MFINSILDYELITKDNLVATLPSWGDQFDVSLELWIESFTPSNSNGWSELLRFTATNKDMGSAGDRIPAIFAHKDGYIGVRSQVGTNANAAKNFNIQIKTWTKVEIKQYQENGKVYNLNNLSPILLSLYVFSGTLNLS